MSRFIRTLTAFALAPVLALSPLVPHAEPTPRVLPDFTVFVDPPTGFVFVKLPAGWKFVGAVDAGTAAATPASVVTRLLEGADTPDAQRPATTAQAR
jgi:hypothetical protein